jgi:DNA uptake protein ComE-like DNA-binding protein
MRSIVKPSTVVTTTAVAVLVTATPEESIAVLSLPAKTAATVVEFRTAHGSFTDLAGLEGVDGMDTAKLEEQPEALRLD